MPPLMKMLPVIRGLVILNDSGEEEAILGERNWILQLGKGCQDPLGGTATPRTLPLFWKGLRGPIRGGCDLAPSPGSQQGGRVNKGAGLTRGGLRNGHFQSRVWVFVFNKTF